MSGGVVHMVVTFYSNNSPEIMLNKTLSTPKQINVSLKADCSIINPVLIVTGVDYTYNYVYIPMFNRYYFIDSVITLNQNTTEIGCRVDPLMSFKNDILAATGIVERNENQFIKYITDNKYTVLNYERIQTKVFPNSFPTNGQFILVVAGS